MEKEIKLTKNTIDEYFSQWAIGAGEQIDKKAKKEKWNEFDYASAINFMLTDIREDVKKLIQELLHDFDVDLQSFLQSALLTQLSEIEKAVEGMKRKGNPESDILLTLRREKEIISKDK